MVFRAEVVFRAVGGVGEGPAGDGVGAGEVAGGVGVVGEDVVSSGGFVEWAAFGIETPLGGGKGEESGEERQGVGEGEMHSGGLRMTSDVSVCVVEKGVSCLWVRESWRKWRKVWARGKDTNHLQGDLYT